MSETTRKLGPIIREACERLVGRASDARGLTSGELSPRVTASVEKYLCAEGRKPEKQEVRAFIDEMRADELCLIVACERGDERAWEELVAQFDQTVKSAARKMSSGPEDADDLASSIWAELYGLRQDAEGNKKSKLAYYSGRGSLAGWLRAVVSQLAIDQYRKDSRYVQVEETRDFENLAEDASNHDGRGVVSHTASPEEIFGEKRAAEDVTAALHSAIEALDAEDKLVLKLYYFDDLKLKDIARTFGYHEATASRKIARLHAEIRTSVEKHLRDRNGWSDREIRKYLAETAAKLGISVEKLFAMLMLAAILQDLAYLGVQNM
jgi:RNA polymerase sigma-70 factor (ECF subfamily)